MFWHLKAAVQMLHYATAPIIRSRIHRRHFISQMTCESLPGEELEETDGEEDIWWLQGNLSPYPTVRVIWKIKSIFCVLTKWLVPSFL